MDHKIISARGGKKTLKRFGKKHFSEIGKLGGAAKLKKYGTDYFKNISAKGVAARRAKAEKKKSLLQHVVDVFTDN